MIANRQELVKQTAPASGGARKRLRRLRTGIRFLMENLLDKLLDDCPREEELDKLLAQGRNLGYGSC